ncbi:MAG: prepilin-type cleavage/methylation domain-containing protein [Alicyclobacillaceae bacterium]|nr:prepilin-type cleavage/methylation domain-containing protein [Alicyclobacillaceae bacterium]
MASRRLRTGPSGKADGGFSLLDVVAAVAVSSLLGACILPGWVRIWTHLELTETTLCLLGHLRWAQAVAQCQDTYASVRLAMYDPQYQTYVATYRVDQVQFAPGVNYKDGYLQLGTGTILYDVFGNAQVGGTIRLCSGAEEQDIHLYIGAGLQSIGGALP